MLIFDNSLFKVSAYLDPQIYVRMTDADKVIAEDLIVKKINAQHFTQRNNHVSQYGTSNVNLPNPLDQFLSKCGLSHHFSPCSTDSVRQRSPREEIALYIEKAQQSDSFQTFWKSVQHDLPGLADLVRSYNMRPATSVASESLFSVASYVQNKHRSRLAPNTLRYSMVLRDRQSIAHLL